MFNINSSFIHMRTQKFGLGEGGGGGYSLLQHRVAHILKAACKARTLNLKTNQTCFTFKGPTMEFESKYIVKNMHKDF